MEIKYDELIKKILDFWKNYDRKEIDITKLKSYFNHYEIYTILYDIDFYIQYHQIIELFQNKLAKLDNLFDDTELDELVGFVSNPSYLFKHMSDEKLLSLISDDEEINMNIASEISSDEAKVKGANLVKSPYQKAVFISYLSSDEMKLKYLKNVSLEYRHNVITSLKDDSLKEKYINFFSSNKGDLIVSLSNDEKRDYYLRKYFKVLSSRDKGKIISSLENDNQVIYYLALCNDKVKAFVANQKYSGNDEMTDKILGMISSKDEIAYILKYNFISNELIAKYIEKINDSNDIKTIVSKLDDMHKIKYLKSFDDNKKVEIIKMIDDYRLQFEALIQINDKKLIKNLIDHIEEFPEYKDEYHPIIDLYAEKYKVDKEHLLFVAKNVSLSILKVIENPNIIKILNASQEDFMTTMNFFNKDKLKMNSSSMNDILNSILQRAYRIDCSNSLLLFPNMLNAIGNKDRNYLVEKINLISNTFDIYKYIKTSLEKFIDLLLEKNETAINCLNEISIKYIISERNNYVQETIETSLDQCANIKYDKNSLIKHVIANSPVELILSFLKNISDESKNYLQEEHELLKNKVLLEKIILYKKNPTNYDQISDDIKSNMKIFNNILKKVISPSFIKEFNYSNVGKKTYEFYEVDSEFLINIMINLDLDKMKGILFNNSEMLEKLLVFWNKYKIGCWGNNFNELLNKAGIIIDPEIIANFIQYFVLSYGSLQKKIERKELSNISLTALLDLAGCYSKESKKYSMIFGEENFRYIAGNPGPNVSSMTKEKRLERALKVLAIIRNRKYVTIPSLDKNFTLKNNKNINVVVGNFSNPINLTYGERTGSCMRIGGAGESLFNFCIEDENGFHIRFSNPDTGKFISRVSGFRNGNTVFLNELRYSEDLNYNNKDIVEACKQVANEIIKLSQSSISPIENVVITPYFAMKESGMQARNLEIANPQIGMKQFYTDVNSTSIVLATTNQSSGFAPFKPGIKGLPKYDVQREKNKILYNKECQEYMVHLKTLDQILSGKAIYETVEEIDENLIVGFAGEDWCVTIDKNGHIEEYIMDNTNDRQKTLNEVQYALTYLKGNLEKEITISKNVDLRM